MNIGGKYNWIGQKERLIYIGRHWSGNGYWHQFEKVDERGKVWCEVTDADLCMFEETHDAMNHTIQCTDVLTGQVGCFGFDKDEYLAADKPLQFKAKTPIFHSQLELFAWARENGVKLKFEAINWG